MRARLPLATPVPFVLLVLLVVGYAPSAGARRRDPMFKEYAPVCEVSLRGISHAERAAALKASQEPPPAPAPKSAPDPVFPPTLFGYRVERQFDPPYRVEALWSTTSGTLRVPELSPRGARAFVEKLGVVLGFSPMPALNSLLIFGPRPFDVRARPAEARSEERSEPTLVGENAPQDRNEGGRDAAASGRRPLEVPDGGREKINGLLSSSPTTVSPRGRTTACPRHARSCSIRSSPRGKCRTAPGSR